MKQHVQSAGLNMQSEKVAFLAYYPLKKRQDNNSFEGNYNIGANVIMDVLNRYNIKVEICTPDTAQKYNIVLVSLTSEYDILSLYQAVALLPSWQPKIRQFKVIAGGAGLQNPSIIRNYLDYAVYGRAEDMIYSLIDCILGGGIFEHQSVMNLPDIHNVKIMQTEKLYPYEINLGSGRCFRKWKETFCGCINRCKFCHYTWARKHIGGDTYYQGDLTTKRSAEVLWGDIKNITKKQGRLRTAIDGFSERLRYDYGKKISNQDIIDGIEHLGSYEGTTVLLVYNISNIPGETEKDRQELYETIKKAKPQNRVLFVLQSTPFRASLLTPMQWSPVNIDNATSDLSAKVIYDSPKLRAIHSFSNESPYSQLITMIINRSNKNTDKLIHTIAYHPYLKTASAKEKIKSIKKSFDLRQYLKMYETIDEHPCNYIESYTPKEKLFKIYKQISK